MTNFSSRTTQDFLKMRIVVRLPEKLNFPVTRTRHIPVIAYIIACSAEDPPYATTKSHRQYIFIQLSNTAMGKEKKKNMLKKKDFEFHMGLVCEAG